MTPIKAAFHLLSSNRLTILIFHRVLASPDPIFPDEPDAARFDQMMRWVKSWFNVMPLDAAVDALKTGKLPVRAAAITFDDGYADNCTVATPILQHHGLSATFFIATGFLDGGRMWNDTVIESVRAAKEAVLDLTSIELGVHPIASTGEKRRAIEAIIGQIKYRSLEERLRLSKLIADAAVASPPHDLMLRSEQIGEMRTAGMQFGAHTVSHPILARTSFTEATVEISRSKQTLEQLLEERIGLFAYPNGKPGTDYLPEHSTLVRQLGFDAAVSTAWGSADSTTDLYQIPRFTPWDQARLRFGLRLLDNFRGSGPTKPTPSPPSPVR